MRYGSGMPVFLAAGYAISEDEQMEAELELRQETDAAK